MKNFLQKIFNGITKETINNYYGREISKKDRLYQYLNLVNNKNKSENEMIIKHLLNIVVEHLNYYEAIQTIEGINKGLKNYMIEQIYGNISIKIDVEPKITTVINKENIDINEIPILIDPWNKDRIINNILFFNNEDNDFDWNNSNGNIQNYFIKPMNIIICRGGNHSQFAAKIKKQGITTITEVRDFSNLYERIRFNGENYLDNKGNIIRVECDKDEIFFYSGIIFELGRYLMKEVN